MKNMKSNDFENQHDLSWFHWKSQEKIQYRIAKTLRNSD